MIILEIAFFGFIHLRLTPPADSHQNLVYPSGVPGDLYAIETIDIKYTVDYDSAFLYRFYKIENINGVYYSNTGEKIDNALIRLLTESFTDLYESEYQSSYNYFRSDHFPHFTVVVTLANGDVVIKSDSSYHCFIPWNIEYNGITYVQYNGKIPSALLKILQKIDTEYWSHYDKEARWGCYEALPLKNSGPSRNFPKTDSVIVPEEEEGKTHIQWKVALHTSIIGRPYYIQGHVFVMVKDGLVSLDAETGEVVWDFQFEREGEPFLYNTENVLVHGSVVYCSAPDSWVYSLDYETGALLWKFKTSANYSFPVKIVGDNLIALTGGVTCLDIKTGDVIWEITDDTWNEEFYEDKILLEGFKDDSYRALIDSKTGTVIWKENLFTVTHPLYHAGLLYFSRPAESTFVCMDVQTKEEVWSYLYGKTLGHASILEDKILLVLFDRKEQYLDALVVLNLAGEEMWVYVYPERIMWEFGYTVMSARSEDTLFVTREGGILEAFSMENKENLWAIEVRGTRITSLQVYEDKIYLSANDGRIYCLDPEKGDILWMVAAENELAQFPGGAQVYVSPIEDGLFFVATIDGNVYAFSV